MTKAISGYGEKRVHAALSPSVCPTISLGSGSQSRGHGGQLHSRCAGAERDVTGCAGAERDVTGCGRGGVKRRGKGCDGAGQ